MAKTKIEVDLVIKGGESVEQVEQKTKSLKTQLKEMKALLASGTLDSNSFNKLAAEAGALEDQIGDVSQRVKNLASDSKGLDGLISVTQGIVGGFAAVQGITALVSDENEELQKTMVKLQGAMSALAGIQALANTLNKDSAAMTTLQSIRLRVLNFVEAQRAASLQYTTVAMQRATFAARMFGAALATLGIGALIAGIVYLIPKITEWISGSKEATKAQNDLTNAIDASNSALENYNKQVDFSTKLAISFAKRQGKSAEDIAKITIDSEEKKLKALEKTYAEQGALYDKLVEGMMSGAVKMDKELLKQTGDANAKLYDNLVEQGNKISLLKVDSDTEAIVKQKEVDKKALEEQRAADKKKAEERRRLKKEADAKAMEDLMTALEEENAADERQNERIRIQGEKEMSDLMSQLELEVEAEQDAADKQIDISKKLADEKLASEKANAEARLSIVNDTYLAINNLGELALGQQFKNTALGKTLALTQIGIDTAMAISSLTKNSQANPTNAVTFGASGVAQFASGIVQITANMLKAKSILSSGGSASAGGGGGSAPSMGGNVSSQPPRLDTFQSNRPAMNPNQRVYVLEKDITDSQGRVARIRHNATLI
jgi:hypothetical protein